MRALSALLVASCLATPVAAKPLITSSENTFVRSCLDRVSEPSRLITICRSALAEFGLTAAQRVDLTVALGDAFLWNGQPQQSVSTYRDATELDARATDAWNGLGWALWETEGDSAAHEAFKTSLSIGVSVQALGGMAATGRRMGTIANAEARDMLEAALAIDPDYIWAVREMAWSHLDDDNAAAALTFFRSALDIEPRDVNARYGVGRAQLALGYADAALDVFNDVLMDAPDDYPTRVYRVIALRDLDRNAQALREADRLIVAYPDRFSGYIERAHALLGLERRSEALKTYQAAEQKLGPNNALLYWYADALTTDGRLKEAMQVIERGIALPGVDYSDYLLKSYIALELGDHGTAREAAEASLATGVNDPWAHYYIAITLVRDGDIEAGVKRFERALATGLPLGRIGDFASELVSAGKFIEAAQLRLKY